MKTNYVNFCIVKIGLLLGIFIFPGTFNATGIINITNKTKVDGQEREIICKTVQESRFGSKYFDIYIDYGKTDKIKKIKDTVGYFPSISCQWHDEMAETYNGSMDHPFKPSVIKKTINLVAKYNKSKNAVILSET